MSVVTTEALTSGSVTGTGFFETLMRTVNELILQEYKKGRITGTDYASTQLGVIQAAMQTASTFVLQSELNNQQVLLAQEQLKTAQKNTLLIEAQIRNMDADTALKTKQLEVVTKELLQADANLALTTTQELQVQKAIDTADKDLTIKDAQLTQMAADKLLADQQLINLSNTNTTITKQQLKLDEEVLLLKDKGNTEKAQINDTVNGSAVTGMMGKQKELYTAQAEGFKRDQEQKLAKLMIDPWISNLTVTGSADAGAAGLDNNEVAKVLAIAKQGIGVI